jgi:hypothetical protein
MATLTSIAFAALAALGQAQLCSLGSAGLNVSVNVTTGNPVVITAFSLFASGNWTVNLAAADATRTSGAVIQLPGGHSVPATTTGATRVLCNNTDVVVSALAHDAFSTESWHLSLAPAAPPLSGTTLTWRVARDWLVATDVESDRVALTLQMTGAPPIHGYQIPGFIDPAMFMNGTAGFPLQDGFFEFLSPTQAQLLVFTPVYVPMGGNSCVAGCTSCAARCCRTKPEYTCTRVRTCVRSVVPFVCGRAGGVYVYATVAILVL